MLSFPRYNDLLVEICVFCRFYPPQSRLKPSQEGFPGTLGMTVGVRS